MGLWFVSESPRWLVRFQFIISFTFCFLILTKPEEKKIVRTKQTYEAEIICFQAKIGHEKEFQISPQRLRGKHADISDEMAEIQVRPVNRIFFN